MVTPGSVVVDVVVADVAVNMYIKTIQIREMGKQACDVREIIIHSL